MGGGNALGEKGEGADVDTCAHILAPEPELCALPAPEPTRVPGSRTDNAPCRSPAPTLSGSGTHPRARLQDRQRAVAPRLLRAPREQAIKHDEDVPQPPA